MADPFAHALREGLYLAILVAAPPLLAAAAAGLLMSLLQASFRIEERTLQIAPRILAALLALAAAGPWIGEELQRFTGAVLSAVPRMGSTVENPGPRGAGPDPRSTAPPPAPNPPPGLTPRAPTPPK